MEAALDSSGMSEENRLAIEALIKEEVEKGVQERVKQAAENRPHSADKPPDGGDDSRHARPAGTELDPQPEDQPRSLEDRLVESFARAMRRTNTPG